MQWILPGGGGINLLKVSGSQKGKNFQERRLTWDTRSSGVSNKREKRW